MYDEPEGMMLSRYGKAGCSFLFDLDYAVSGDDCFSLDAQYYGNEARFINHSCDPNMHNYQVLDLSHLVKTHRCAIGVGGNTRSTLPEGMLLCSPRNSSG